jgi:hypothetical protein
MRAPALPALWLAALCGAAAAQAPAAQTWFVPPPPKAGAAAVDTRSYGNFEEVTVTAARRPIQRNPHGEEDHAFQPYHSEAAAPTQGNAGQRGCEGTAYQTIAGQAATSADMIGMGGAGC